jgi:hypothetical protein
MDSVNLTILLVFFLSLKSFHKWVVEPLQYGVFLLTPPPPPHSVIVLKCSNCKSPYHMGIPPSPPPPTRRTELKWRTYRTPKRESPQDHSSYMKTPKLSVYGRGHGNLDFFGPSNGTRLTARCHFTGPKKVSISRAQPPPTCPHNGVARIKSITYGAVSIIGP